MVASRRAFAGGAVIMLSVTMSGARFWPRLGGSAQSIEHTQKPGHMLRLARERCSPVHRLAAPFAFRRKFWFRSLPAREYRFGCMIGTIIVGIGIGIGIGAAVRVGLDNVPPVAAVVQRGQLWPDGLVSERVMCTDLR